ncbi:interferon regulatory factor 8-like [Polyodon spathula]|uniref:interferon regulatory factor 8-like n=1 Tax=Polyodon spathula TaxID=7913 RepID=UPI001B7EBC6F|nr:interferon regulatory factor 8-like [Polyodon spathula]
MATGRVRSSRKLKQWIMDQLLSEQYPGLVWDDPDRTMFRIPWKHAGKQDFRSDEDAAIFKAWAVFKGKLRAGDKEDPPTWKTRLRCALNKSSEFEEVPGRSQLDISEPYKVYRIVPLSEQGNNTGAVHRDSRGRERERGMKRRRVKSESQTGTDCAEIGPGKPVREESAPTGFPLPPPPPSLSLSALPSMLITVFYSGLEVSQRRIMGKDVRIASRLPARGHAPSPASSVEKVWFPSAASLSDPVRSQALSRLLPFLERGVLLASRPQGLFIQRLCQGRVFWSGPGAPHHDRPNKLDRQETLVQLFDSKQFSRNLEVYRVSGGQPPQFKVTLCFGEEFPDNDPVTDKLITVQVELPRARQQLEEVTSFRESVALLQDLASQSPLGEVTLNLYGIS